MDWCIDVKYLCTQDAVFTGAGAEDSDQPTGALERFKKRKTEA